MPIARDMPPQAVHTQPLLLRNPLHHRVRAAPHMKSIDFSGVAATLTQGAMAPDSGPEKASCAALQEVNSDTGLMPLVCRHFALVSEATCIEGMQHQWPADLMI